MTEPRPDVIQLPNAMLASLARPLQTELKRPIHCTLQGEDLFPRWRFTRRIGTRRSRLIRENAAYVDRFTAVSEYYAVFMSEYLGIPSEQIDVVPLGINLDGFERRRESDVPAVRRGVSRQNCT